MTNGTKFLTALSVGGVLISTAAGFMVVNAQSASAYPETNTSISTNPKNGNKIQKNDAVKLALENNDYNAWKAAMANAPKGAEILAKVDTQEKFNQLSEVHKAVKTAQDARYKVMTDLGLTDLMGPGKDKNMKKFGKGMMRNQNTQNTPITNQ